MKAEEYLKEFTREELELHISILEAELKEAREQKDELISTWKSTKSPACMDELINKEEQT